jgi:hypothetical protein
MNEKIYCKDCKRFKKNEHDEKTIYYHCFSAAAAIDDFCFMPEKKEDAKSEFYAIGKIEAGDAVYVIARDEVEKMKAENNRLRKLMCEIRDFLIGGATPGYVHLKQECIREIHTIANEEDQKRRAGE